MSEHPSPQPSERMPDPRSRLAFQQGHYPQVNGQPPPAQGSSNRNDRIKLEFLAVYCELNGAHAGLQALRNAPDFARRRDEETRLLLDTERLLILRDELEDEYAPVGVIVEPVVKGGFTVNLKMSFGNEDAAGRRRNDCYTITAYVPIPTPPDDIKLEKLAFRIEGPLIPSPWTEAVADSAPPS